MTQAPGQDPVETAEPYEMTPLTKAELMERIKDWPDDAPVYVATGRGDWEDGRWDQPVYSVADDKNRVVLEQ